MICGGSIGNQDDVPNANCNENDGGDCGGGGIAGGEGFDWSCVIRDALVTLLFGAILRWVWNWFGRKHSIVNGIII